MKIDGWVHVVDGATIVSVFYAAFKFPDVGSLSLPDQISIAGLSGFSSDALFQWVERGRIL